MSERDPHWYRDAVIYQLHVKSFFDANDDGVGDFAGLMRKLDYFAELGVNTLWLLPFYPSPRRDDGYDIADYRRVHPDYGTLADARRFVREAHRRGLNVITDLVINHTSDQNPWFQRARRAPPGSWQRNFYVWSKTDDRYAGTRIIFLDTEVSNWAWENVAQAYYWHRFCSHQPDLNHDNPRVLEAVLAVMRFWLDLGVDGLRLDAVPYLVEREGTSNENLPETTPILKRIRAEVDRAYPGRMLLAEANQWPEDTEAKLGDGDECHMAFHFPLMPRMYMAIAQEDRFPIADILRQTPDIPPGCQWAIFLRNHDELTLEMVTDRERDYLWNTYAADRRARLNLGIRRRLAPLLEHDRRRIELMNGLLLSMPGTPVIYCGDEIGMGDNIYLGDRDSVPTPMQRSPDRNGGLSRADPARLVLLPIQDPIYGFQDVNVEAQSRDPHSLLNWTRRMLAVRTRSRAFGRSALRLLYPSNRKVLAYLREEGEDTILCVFNVSRAAQAVELDLSGFAGRVPVEMLGGTAFPPIGRLTYLLTRPPYAFYWFVLAEEMAMPGWHVKTPEPLPELRTIIVRNDATELLNPAVRRELEREIQPVWLPLRRWFAAKGETPRAVRIAAHATLPHTGGYLVLAEAEAAPEGHAARLFLPLAAVAEESPSPLPARLALSRLRQVRRVGYLTDAFASDALVPAVLACLREGATMTCEATRKFTSARLPARGRDPRHRSLRAHRSAGGGRDAPAVRRAVELDADPWRDGGAEAAAPARPRHSSRGRDDAPSHRLRLRGRAGAARRGRAHRPRRHALHADAAAVLRAQPGRWLAVDARPAEASRGRGGAERSRAGRCLRRLPSDRRGDRAPAGGLHAVLARPSDDPAFAPEPASAEDARAWGAETLAQLDGALRALADAAVPEAAQPFVAELRAAAKRLRRTVPRLVRRAAGALKMRHHGDFHLGQVLIAQGDAVIVDFEGEPARTLADRRAKACALRDVAGLLRSFDYAAAVATTTEMTAAAVAAPAERRAALVTAWREAASRAFLDAYRAARTAAPQRIVAPAAEAALLDLFLLQRAAYEVRYEAANRPEWLPVPLRGLVALAARIAP